MLTRDPLRVAAAQPKVGLHDLGTNVESHATAVRRARSQLVVFPEMSLTGYDMDAPTVGPSSRDLIPLVDACREVGATALVGAPVERGRGRGIGVLAVDADGCRLVYVKMSLGEPEAEHFVSGSEPAVVTIGGWRVGVGVCKDTRIDSHLEATISLGIDLYAAGLIHTPAELHELDVRAQRIARAFAVPVVFAGFAGPTGEGFSATSGGSGVWDASGHVMSRCGPNVDEFAAAVLTSDDKTERPPGRVRGAAHRMHRPNAPS